MANMQCSREVLPLWVVVPGLGGLSRGLQSLALGVNFPCRGCAGYFGALGNFAYPRVCCIITGKVLE